MASSTDVAAPCSVRLPVEGARALGLGPALLRRRVVLDVALEVRADRAGHEGVGGDAVARPAPRRLDGEQRVGRLRLAVGQPRVVLAALEVDVLEHDRREPVRARAERDDARVAGGRERFVQAQREREVAEVVGRELAAPSPRGVRLGRRHHAGVVDEDVQRAVPGVRERGDRRAIGEVEVAHVDVGVARRRGDVAAVCSPASSVAHGERDRRRRRPRARAPSRRRCRTRRR